MQGFRSNLPAVQRHRRRHQAMRRPVGEACLYTSSSATSSRRSSTRRTVLGSTRIMLLLLLLLLSSARSVAAFSATSTTSDKTDLAALSLTSSQCVELSHLEYCHGHTKGRVVDTKPAKAPVIFLHGLLGNKRNFSSIARSLCGRLKHPRHILGVDLRNHGDTSLQQHCNDMSYTTMAGDVLHFMDSNGIASAELIGHSVGGKVAQYVLKMERV
jgi:pimeloyl-ACP methyl ester carboxylesterase